MFKRIQRPPDFIKLTLFNDIQLAHLYEISHNKIQLYVQKTEIIAGDHLQAYKLRRETQRSFW